MHSRQDRPLPDEALDGIISHALGVLGLGDEEWRRIFVLVLSQELTPRLAGIRSELAEQRSRPARSFSPELMEMAQLATGLRQAISRVPAADKALLLGELTTSDTFGHGYSDAYLQALERELARLTDSCSAILTPPGSSTTDILPLCELIGVLAKAYAECFESEPEAATDGPFARLLATIFAQVGLDLPVTRELLDAGLAARRSLGQ